MDIDDYNSLSSNKLSVNDLFGVFDNALSQVLRGVYNRLSGKGSKTNSILEEQHSLSQELKEEIPQIPVHHESVLGNEGSEEAAPEETPVEHESASDDEGSEEAAPEETPVEHESASSDEGSEEAAPEEALVEHESASSDEGSEEAAPEETPVEHESASGDEGSEEAAPEEAPVEHESASNNEEAEEAVPQAPVVETKEIQISLIEQKPLIMQYYLCNVVDGKTVCEFQREMTLLGINSVNNNNGIMKCCNLKTSGVADNCLRHGEHADMHHNDNCHYHSDNVTFA
ncbi:hypothetical protein EDL79_00135 [Ehrlichia ruminantium]|uniref:Uncharacterized protein n=1 Tax=Ehrlichia ruminantium TaxID=779 RepID=A0AAE6Q9K9_EHRRU|nr:hypothetical protein [Ehrlichia ruminantium]QGR02114.1 hypothetical protein EDL81_00135 [Ehrlichia ruminantium]QGR03034.1 hypothetical protein EDL80_00135 [Ehrlichia ruminantium]QGR03959.1 hypothetical protein EDL79_00135 [Ehrlichia ruminantium]